jgi:hypothetical protein
MIIMIKSTMIWARACSTHGREEKYIEDFDGKVRKDHYEDLEVCGNIILKRVLEK